MARNEMKVKLMQKTYRTHIAQFVNQSQHTLDKVTD